MKTCKCGAVYIASEELAKTITVADVREYRETHGLGIHEAKQRLLDQVAECPVCEARRLFEAPGIPSGATERATHPEGKEFANFFDRLLFPPATKSCWERDLVRAAKETLWDLWKKRAKADE
jgi:hypothetical protein